MSNRFLENVEIGNVFDDRYHFINNFHDNDINESILGYDYYDNVDDNNHDDNDNNNDDKYDEDDYNQDNNDEDDYDDYDNDDDDDDNNIHDDDFVFNDIGFDPNHFFHEDYCRKNPSDEYYCDNNEYGNK